MKSKDIEVGKTYAVGVSKFRAVEGKVLETGVRRRLANGWGYEQNGVKVQVTRLRITDNGREPYLAAKVVRPQDIWGEWDAYQAQQAEEEKQREEYDRQVEESRHRALTEAARVAYAADQALRAKGVKPEGHFVFGDRRSYVAEAGFEAEGEYFMSALNSLSDAMRGRYSQDDVALLLGLGLEG